MLDDMVKGDMREKAIQWSGGLVLRCRVMMLTIQ
jgi:hypothetical protein